MYLAHTHHMPTRPAVPCVQSQRLVLILYKYTLYLVKHRSCSRMHHTSVIRHHSYIYFSNRSRYCAHPASCDLWALRPCAGAGADHRLRVGDWPALLLLLRLTHRTCRFSRGRAVVVAFVISHLAFIGNVLSQPYSLSTTVWFCGGA